MGQRLPSHPRLFRPGAPDLARRAAEAETRLKDRERLLKEAQRRPIDKELADKQRAVLSQVRAQCGGAWGAAACGAPRALDDAPRAMPRRTC